MEHGSFGTLFESLKFFSLANSRRIRPKDTEQNISNQKRHVVTAALLVPKEEKKHQKAWERILPQTEILHPSVRNFLHPGKKINA